MFKSRLIRSGIRNDSYLRIILNISCLAAPHQRRDGPNTAQTPIVTDITVVASVAGGNLAYSGGTGSRGRRSSRVIQVEREGMRSMDRISCAVVPGDGIGAEVVAEGVRVLEAAAELDGGFEFDFETFPWGCQYYAEHGEMMPGDGLSTLANFETIFLGAVGYPGVPDHVSLWGLLIPIRRTFQQYINLRPCRLLNGVTSPLRDKAPGSIDFVVVRENSEGEYSSMGGRIHQGTPYEMAIQNTVFTRMGTERVIRYAYELASNRGKRLTSATKSNGINITMPYWDEILGEVGSDYPDVRTDNYHIDALAAYFVTRPESFDVVVGSNLFGDILSDLAAAVMGGIGMAPAANLNPERVYPSMFEPVHGSAPDIAGRGIANPIGQIWTAKMLLDHIGKQELGTALLNSIEAVLAAGEVQTPDLGGRAGTTDMGDAILAEFRRRG
jgi:tartrate dehydrogenase/decarboxylase / D-malate dehydrogenase